MASTKAVNHFIRRRLSILQGISATLTLRNVNLLRPTTQINWYSTNEKTSTVTTVDRKRLDNQSQVGFAEVVKENTKSAWYITVILAGVGVTAIMFYTIFRELFSSKSANNVYTKALERCMKDPKVSDMLGEPIKAFGEETRRGRRGHVRHDLHMRDGVPHLRMQFYIQGNRKRGTVHLEVRENASGAYEYRYLFVQLDDLARTTILLEDNRTVTTTEDNFGKQSEPRLI